MSDIVDRTDFTVHIQCLTERNGATFDDGFDYRPFEGVTVGEVCEALRRLGLERTDNRQGPPYD